MTIRATVTMSTSVPPRFLLILQLGEGEVEPGQQLTSGSTRLRVDGLGFAPPDAWQRGLRAITVTLLSGPPLEVGAELVEATPEGLR